MNNMVICSDVNYQEFLQNFVTQAVPYYINYDNNYPLGTIRFYPVPSTNYTFTC